jgi:hypothetical protein
MHKDVEGDLQEGFRNREREIMATAAADTGFEFAEAFKRVADDEL